MSHQESTFEETSSTNPMLLLKILENTFATHFGFTDMPTEEDAILRTMAMLAPDVFPNPFVDLNDDTTIWKFLSGFFDINLFTLIPLPKAAAIRGKLTQTSRNEHHASALVSKLHDQYRKAVFAANGVPEEHLIGSSLSAYGWQTALSAAAYQLRITLKLIRTRHQNNGKDSNAKEKELEALGPEPEVPEPVWPTKNKNSGQSSPRDPPPTNRKEIQAAQAKVIDFNTRLGEIQESLTALETDAKHLQQLARLADAIASLVDDLAHSVRFLLVAGVADPIIASATARAYNRVGLVCTQYKQGPYQLDLLMKALEAVDLRPTPDSCTAPSLATLFSDVFRRDRAPIDAAPNLLLATVVHPKATPPSTARYQDADDRSSDSDTPVPKRQKKAPAAESRAAPQAAQAPKLSVVVSPSGNRRTVSAGSAPRAAQNSARPHPDRSQLRSMESLLKNHKAELTNGTYRLQVCQHFMSNKPGTTCDDCNNDDSCPNWRACYTCPKRPGIKAEDCLHPRFMCPHRSASH